MFKSKNSRNEILHPEIGQSYDSDRLNLKEKMVIDFITKNPGVTKQKVVDALDGKFSRVIVFNTIRELENFDIIMIKKINLIAKYIGFTLTNTIKSWSSWTSFRTLKYLSFFYLRR
jgi:hypothetical protein